MGPNVYYVLIILPKMFVLYTDEDFNASLEWLLKQAGELNWTVQLHLGECMQDWIPGYKKVSVLNDLSCDVSVQSHEWTQHERFIRFFLVFFIIHMFAVL